MLKIRLKQKSLFVSLLLTLTTISLPTMSAIAQTSQLTSVTTSNLSTSHATQPVTIYFVNGIFNTDIQAQTSAIALFDRLIDNPQFSNLVTDQKVTLRTLYNPMDFGLNDLSELDAQAQIQNQALALTNAKMQSDYQNTDYTLDELSQIRQAIYNQALYEVQQNELAKNYSKLDTVHTLGTQEILKYKTLAQEVKRSLQAGEKVLLVAHSQGNYVAQGIYSELLQDATVNIDLANNLQVVGVANVAATSPSNNYITNADDKAVYLWHVLQGGKPMIANFAPQFADGEPLSGAFESVVQRQNDSQNHDFIETYLAAHFDTSQNFIPHQPTIVEKSSYQPIYQNVVQRVMVGINTLLTPTG